jgi:hypothetical protein
MEPAIGGGRMTDAGPPAATMRRSYPREFTDMIGDRQR